MAQHQWQLAKLLVLGSFTALLVWHASTLLEALGMLTGKQVVNANGAAIGVASPDSEDLSQTVAFMKGDTPRTGHFFDQITYFPQCSYQQQPIAFEDFTLSIKRHPDLVKACVSNPSILHLQDDKYLLSYRIYTSAHGHECLVPDKEGGQWFEWWKGRNGLGLAVVQYSGPGQAHILKQVHDMDTSVEDARLFRDDTNSARLLYNRWRSGNAALAGIKRGQRRSFHVAEVKISSEWRRIEVVNERELMYVNQNPDEKNWVPWEGTTKMSYPQYPGFAPHNMLDWRSYSEPQDQEIFSTTADAPFFANFRKRVGGWVRFSGGTPAVRLDNDRFLAMGHAVGDLHCFHKSLGLKNQPGYLGDHACNASNPAPDGDGEWWTHFTRLNHTIPEHHPYWDYFFFLYAFSAEAPHKITHISHAFIPYDAASHRGVYFPAGLQSVPDGIMISYGKDDNRVMVMTLPREAIAEYLMPADELDPAKYEFCTVGKGRPYYRLSQ